MKSQIPSPYFFMMFSAFLVLSYYIGFYVCNNTNYCGLLGSTFYKLGLFGLFIIPLGALYQLGIAAVQNLKGNKLFKHNAISGLASFVLLIFLIGMAIKLNPAETAAPSRYHNNRPFLLGSAVSQAVTFHKPQTQANNRKPSK